MIFLITLLCTHHSPNDASHQGNSAPLKRAMSTRHLVMISLGGAIGTGLFLGSGEVIAQTGPVGAIISVFFRRYYRLYGDALLR